MKLYLFAITGGVLVKPALNLFSRPLDTDEALRCWLETEKPPVGDYRANLLDVREFGPADWEGVRDWVTSSALTFCQSQPSSIIRNSEEE